MSAQSMRCCKTYLLIHTGIGYAKILESTSWCLRAALWQQRWQNRSGLTTQLQTAKWLLTFEVQQVADKVDDYYKRMPFLGAPPAYQPLAYPPMARALPYSAGPPMGSYQPAYRQYSMVKAASSMARFPAAAEPWVS